MGKVRNFNSSTPTFSETQVTRKGSLQFWDRLGKNICCMYPNVACEYFQLYFLNLNVFHMCHDQSSKIIGSQEAKESFASPD